MILACPAVFFLRGFIIHFIMFIIDVIPLTRLPRHLPQTLSYFSSNEIKKGVLVMIKIRNKETPGIVINCDNAKERRIEIKRKDFEMKPISKIISNIPILNEKQIQLALWMAKYYLEPLTFVFKSIAPKLPKKIVRDIMIEMKNTSITRIVKSPTAPKSLMIKSNDIKNSLNFIKPDIKKNLGVNRQILILVPEINLAEKISAIIRSDFSGEEIIDLGNKSAGNKFLRQYLKIKNNRAKIIIATRSGALLPFFNLGLIIILDEGSASHKQWEGHPLYDARDVAEKLSKLFDAKLIRESVTPSIVSYYKSQSGIYDFCSLVDKKTVFTQPEIIDMRSEQRKGNFSLLSENFTDKINQTIKEKKQAILFVNRRGAANFIVCKNCGSIAKCPVCQIPLIYYPEIKNQTGAVKYERLICNHCNFSCQPQNTCTKCKGAEIKYMGLGTQKIENQIKRDFPHLNVIRYDSDTIKNKKDRDHDLESFSNKTPSVLIATQQIFSAPTLPEISFVGIISLDAMLALPDFQTNERVFTSTAKLMSLCKSLAIQTYNPENPVIKFLSKMDYETLCQNEIDERRILFYPPFSQIIKLSYRHISPQNAKREAMLFAELLRKTLSDEITKKTVKIMGPAPRFIFQEKGFYNWHIILKIKDLSADIATTGSDDKNDIEQQIKNKIEKILPENWEIDVNPENLL